MKPLKLVVVLTLLTSMLLGTALWDQPSQAQSQPLTLRPRIIEGLPAAFHSAGTPQYIFTQLRDETFLRADGSAVLYLSNSIRNDSSSPMSGHGWCFYWGRGVYSNVFAKDAGGYMAVNYYEHYSDDYDQWGLCVEVSFRQSIQNGAQYQYALGITVANHHTVTDDIIRASWAVNSSSAIQTYTAKVSWPYNHEGVTADPSPDILQNSYAQWTRTSAEAPWRFTVNLTITLGDQMAVDPLSQGIRPFDGRDIAWEDDPYGVNTGHSIGDWGCYLTSCTMAMNYFARVLGMYQQTDPGVLNTWLATPAVSGGAPRGYARSAPDSTAYSMVDSSVMDDASEALFDTTSELIVPGALENLTGVAGMRDNLQNGQLGVLNVNNSGYGHFVLVTGYTSQNGVATVTLNDPYENRGAVTLLAQYGNQHLGNVRWFSPGDQGVRPNYVTLYANCPVELLATDQYGRRAGYDPRTGQRYNEIPGSAYVTQYYPADRISAAEGTKILQIESYEPSRYRIDIIGTGTGRYTIDYTAELASGETDRSTVTGTTTAGEVDSLHLTYDPNVGLIRPVFLPLVWR